MTSTLQFTQKTFASLCIAVLFFVAFAPFASAKTYYYEDNTVQNQALIAQLQQQVYALMAQLQALKNGNAYTYTYPQQQTYTYGNYYTGNGNLDVITGNADVQNGDTVVLHGSVSNLGSTYARVWFEYGKNGNMSEQTGSKNVTNNNSFVIEASGINGTGHFYYRAVAEDASGYRVYGGIQSLDSRSTSHSYNDNYYNNHSYNHSNNSNVPDVTTNSARNINAYTADLRGDVDMNDFDSGLAFFVYGEDESQVDDASGESRYSDISSDGRQLQKVQLSSNIDNTRTFSTNVSGLRSNTEHFFRLCVEYKDDNDDKTLECGDVENFDTDSN